MSEWTLEDFVRESNRIEGINRDPSGMEISSSVAFLARPEIEIAHISRMVSAFQPDAVLRDRPGLNVRVGDHIAPPGGQEVACALLEIVGAANCRSPSDVAAYDVHLGYETLHPYTDGNGRSGRMLWLWMMGGINRAPLGFLHHFYYQTLSAQ